MVIVSKNGLYDLANHNGLVRCTVDVENRDRLIEGACWDFVLLNIVLIDEQAGRAAVDEHRSTPFDARISGFKLDVDCEGVNAEGG